MDIDEARKLIAGAEEAEAKLAQQMRIRELAGCILARATAVAARMQDDRLEKFKTAEEGEALDQLLSGSCVFDRFDFDSDFAGVWDDLPSNLYRLRDFLDEHWRDGLAQAVTLVNQCGVLEGLPPLSLKLQGEGQDFDFEILFS